MKKIIILALFLGSLGILNTATAVFIKSETDDDTVTITISFKEQRGFKENEIDTEYKNGKQSFSLAEAIYYDDDGHFRKVKSQDLIAKIGRQVRLRLAGLIDSAELPNASKPEKVRSIEIYFKDISKKNHLNILTDCLSKLQNYEVEELPNIEVSTDPYLAVGLNFKSQDFTTNYPALDEESLTKAAESLGEFKRAKKKQRAQQEKEKKTGNF